MEADASTLDMPSDCCYFVEKAAAAGAAPAFQYFDSIFHHFAVVTQNLGQTRGCCIFSLPHIPTTYTPITPFRSTRVCAIRKRI